MKPKPCIKCEGTNLETSDAGYTTFNPGWMKCLDCGYTILIGNCDDKNSKAIIVAWNEAKILEKIKNLKEQIALKGIYDPKINGKRI